MSLTFNDLYLKCCWHLFIVHLIIPSQKEKPCLESVMIRKLKLSEIIELPRELRKNQFWRNI